MARPPGTASGSLSVPPPDPLPVAAALTASPAAEPPTAAAAFERIRAWRQALRAIAGVAEAQVMAACWVVREALPDRADFEAAVARELGGLLDPDRALALAETWGVARRQRALRVLASSDPGEAVRFVRDLAEAAGSEGAEALDDDDREVAELLALPPRRRRERLRSLVRLRRGAAPPPAPVRIEAPAPPPPAPAGPGEPDRLLSALREIEGRLQGLAAEVGAARGDPGWTAARWERLLKLTDLATGDLDEMAVAAHEAREAEGRKP